MPKEPIPRGLEYLYEKYMRHEMVEWKNVQLGTKIVVEAYDRKTGDDNFLPLTILRIDTHDNGLLTPTMVVGDTEMIATEDTPERELVCLPEGTILKSGVSAQFFPNPNATMTYFGGISINRDLSFRDVLLPDGRAINGVLIPQVKSLMSFMPEKSFEPIPLNNYDDAIDQHYQEALSKHEKAVAELDKTILDRANTLFSDDKSDTRDEILAQIATFNPEGRYTLLCLMEYSNDQGVLAQFNDVLKAAMQEEFSYLHPKVRGTEMFPATQRGWQMMVRELGLKFE